LIIWITIIYLLFYIKLFNQIFFKTVAIDTPGGNLSLKIKSRAQQITLKPNIIKVKILIS
jgi:hypothetical protein